MPETDIKIGGSLKADSSAARAVDRFRITAKYAEAAGFPWHVVLRETPCTEDEYHAATYMLRDRGGEISAEPLKTQPSVHAIRDLTGNLGKSQSALLNEPEIITAGSKRGVVDLCGDLMPATVFHDGSEMVPDLDHIPGDMVVVKPAQSRASKRVAFVPKQYAPKVAMKYPDGVIIQEVASTQHLPQGLRGLTVADDQRLRAAQGARELRLYAVSGLLVPLAKLARGTARTMAKSDYAPLAPESVPDTAYQLGRLVLERLQTATSIDWILAGIDMTYDAEKEREWSLMEVNLREPAVPKEKDHPETSRVIRTALIQQLIELAQREM